MTTKILIPDRLSPPCDVEQSVFGDDVEIIAPVARHTSEIPDDVWAEADAVIAWHELMYDAPVIDRLKKCKALVRAGVGFDNVDIAAAGANGIAVCTVPDYGTRDVADHALSMILSLSRGLPAFSSRVQAGNDAWHWGAAGPLRRLAGSTLGIIGLGRIGAAVARRAQAFSLRVIFYDPYVADGLDKALDVERVDRLNDLLGQADIVTFHAPLTPETRDMANADFFANLKPGAVLVNTARGAIIDTAALADAMKSGKVRGAGLDVLPEEPADDNDPLVGAWRNEEPWLQGRLIITPHAAFVCDEAYAELRRKAALEAKRILDGEPARNCVNREYLVNIA